MIFPEIKILDTKRSKYGEKLHICKLDWSKNEKGLIEYKKKWYKSYVDIDPKLVDFFFDNVITDQEKREYFFPQSYQKILDTFSDIVIPENYLKEIEHFEMLAKSEWTRDRNFDTNIREGCLSVGEECVDRYFYLLLDCHYMYNREFGMDVSHNKNYISGQSLYPGDKHDYTTLEYSMIKPLWLYRFWKHQTGGGLVINKLLEKIKNKNERMILLADNMKKILLKNNKFRFIKSNYFSDNSDDTITEEIKKRILHYKRTQKLKRIL